MADPFPYRLWVLTSKPEMYKPSTILHVYILARTGLVVGHVRSPTKTQLDYVRQLVRAANGDDSSVLDEVTTEQD